MHVTISPSAPVDATYITQTANGVLTAEQNLAALATGLLKNTTTTGVLSIGVAGTDYATTLATVASLSTTTAHQTFQLEAATNVIFEQADGDDILTIYEADKGVQALGHVAMGALAAIDGGSLTSAFGIESCILDIEETFTGAVAYNVGEMIYLKANAGSPDPFLTGISVNVSDEDGTQSGFGAYGLEFAVNTFNDGAYSYGFIGNAFVRSGAADTAYGGFITAGIEDGSVNNLVGLTIGIAILGGTVTGNIGLEVLDVVGATTNYAIQTGLGQVEFGDRLTVNQNSTTAAVPTLRLKQADLSEEFIRFESTVGAGNPVNTTALGAYYGRVRVYVEGVGIKWLALYDS